MTNRQMMYPASLGEAVWSYPKGLLGELEWSYPERTGRLGELQWSFRGPRVVLCTAPASESLRSLLDELLLKRYPIGDGLPLEEGPNHSLHCDGKECGIPSGEKRKQVLNERRYLGTTRKSRIAILSIILLIMWRSKG